MDLVVRLIRVARLVTDVGQLDFRLLCHHSFPGERTESAAGRGVRRRTERPDVETPRSALRGGAIVALAAGASIVLNYIFLFSAGRLLGSDDYGVLAAIIGLLTIVLLPSGALQMAVSREVSWRNAQGDGAGAAAFSGGIVRAAWLATLPLLVVFYALLVPMRNLLSIDSTAALAIAGVALIGAFTYPAGLGVIQGQQRFGALAGCSFLPFAVRVAVLAVLAAVGIELLGVVAAVVLSSLVGVTLALVLVAPWIRKARPLRFGALHPFLRYLAPVVLGLIGMTILTNADILVVKARFPDDDAGVYGAALGVRTRRVLSPRHDLDILFPRAAARQARGEATEDILGRSLLLTAGFCVVLAVAYATIGERVVTLSFGAEFERSGPLLALFAIEMTLFSLSNVLVGFHLSQGEPRFAYVVAGAVIVQLSALALFPDTLREVILVNASVGAGLLLAHELVIGSSVPGAALRITGPAADEAGIDWMSVAEHQSGSLTW